MMPKLEIEYFNPVVDDWNDEAYQRELYERDHCDYCPYVLTPKMIGYYAMAEVVDDSYKRPDRTIFCYLPKDGDDEFNRRELKSFDTMGKKVEENGGIWFHSLDEIIQFLNSSKFLKDTIIHDPKKLYDIFISYGRRHSKDFATKLYDQLIAKEQKVWFDQNNIPLGVDFQEQINDGITKSHNFIFVISPHSVRSEYCLKEIELAVKQNKRIIPLLHVKPKDDWDKMHPTIEKLNWIYFQDGINNFNNSFKGLTALINTHVDYMQKHTMYLNRALEWENKQKPQALMLTGTRRQHAENWLRIEFSDTQAPCLPSDLHCEYICASKEIANNQLTDVYFCYATEENEIPHKFHFALMRKSYTIWTK